VECKTFKNSILLDNFKLVLIKQIKHCNFFFIFLFNTSYSSAILDKTSEQNEYYYNTSNVIIKGEKILKLISLLNYNIIPNVLWLLVQNINDNIIFINYKNSVIHNHICKMLIFDDFTSYNYNIYNTPLHYTRTRLLYLLILCKTTKKHSATLSLS